MIRTGGEGVVPAEVEAALRDHPAVADVAVVGVADDRLRRDRVRGHRDADPTVVSPSLDELRAFAGEHLAGFKLPRRLEVVDAIPRTAATGQVQRHLVLDLIS